MLASSAHSALLALIPAVAFSCTVEEERFSDRQDTAVLYLEIALRPSAIGNIDELAEYIGDPPAPNGFVHCRELEKLHEARILPDKLNGAICEVDLDCWVFGGRKLEKLAQDKPATFLLILTSLWHVDQKIFALKLHFDRARPYQVDSHLVPLISEPQHPSYPSGHAAQAYTIAAILAELEPSLRDDFFADAYRVSRNRELVRVHYESDTRAGERLAERMHSLLRNEEWFARQEVRARLEWSK
jgi:hypothetical protein